MKKGLCESAEFEGVCAIACVKRGAIRRVKKGGIIWTLLLLWTTLLHAQPEMRDGGLIIREVHVGLQRFMPVNDLWTNQSHSSTGEVGKLSVNHFTLNEKGKESKNPIDPVDLSEYDLAEKPSFPIAIYLPPYVGNQTTLSHRLIFCYDKDTMIVDILNIPERSFLQPYTLDAIHFKPGKYVYNFSGQEQLTPKDAHEVAWLNYFRKKGITPESEPYLVKYGYLNYSPPRNVKSQWKYVVPQVTVEQPTRFDVLIKIQGNFLGRIAPEQSLEMIVNPLYQIERYYDHRWSVLPIGTGLDYERDSVNVASKYYQQRVVQLTSEDKHAGPGFKPGKYRVKFVASNREIIASSEFYLGMLEPEKTSPYQTLYRDSKGFPRYRLDVNDDIFIQTQFLPTISTGSSNPNMKTYHFRYFDGQEDGLRPVGEPSDPEDLYTRHFVQLISKRRVHINDEPIDGRVKFAFFSSSMEVNSRRMKTDIYIVDYVSGKPTNVQILKDVDLNSETTPVRNY